jgi:methionine--tRNA ligase beta chain
MADQPAIIQYDDFAKLDLRVGTIKSCEPHPNADKLLVLQVDLGSEQRQILAGLKAYYEPEYLVGKQIIVIANLAPRQMRGLESQGMLLAASNDDKDQVIFVTPEKPIDPGAGVS